MSFPSKEEKMDTISFIAILSWFIWKACNVLFFLEKCMNFSNIFSNAYRLLKESKSACRSFNVDGESLTTSFWSPPPIGCVKINFDAAFSPSSNDASIGIIVHGDEGVFFMALAKPGFFTNSALIAEGLAARVGLLKALSLGAKDCVLEGDCWEVISALKNNIDSCPWTNKCINQDCKFLASRFGNISFSWIRRDANKPAHILASKASLSLSKEEWVEYPPNWLLEPILTDVCTSLGAAPD